MEVPYNSILEGLLFAAGDEGLTKKQLMHALELGEEEIEKELAALREAYNAPTRGLSIMELKGAYYLTTKQEHAVYHRKLLESPQSSKLSQAALETLAIIAYKQPITRIEVEEVRGVKSERPIQTLVARGFIEESGRKEGIGRPILYVTTLAFLAYFGLHSLDDLPPLPEGVDDPESAAELFFEDFPAETD
ncbi:segregation and condensation protein B [Terribacillus halophilus]|uniref:Segregation and condensation protein B n=1 Tax=Terribacillus halophilus TaxID=361279 RepID=A0A1G6UXY2_9BACI|nr:SMC-Scp complex subunit ScpB [Terribacillus halophilus]SDD46148.1 segregation and condensation protein B [Terribacillus halophilus]